MKDKAKISQKRWNYLAGMVDGDGSLSIGAHPHEQNYVNYDVVFGVGLTHLPTVKWLKNVFGGGFYTTQDKRPNRKPNHHWYISSSLHQLSLLKMLTPRLRLKQQQGEALIEFLELGGRFFQNPEIRKQIADFVSSRNEFFAPVYRTKSVVEKVTADKSDYQYLSGLIDAEGCVSLYESRRSFDPKIQIANTDMRVFDFLLDRFGGSVSTAKRYQRELGNWVLPTRFLENTLLATIPYLVTKRKQAILLLEWYRNRKVLSDDTTQTMIDQFRVMNYRGSVTTNMAACPANGRKIESELVGDYESAPLVTATA